ncbi:phospholipase A and acyltransferase 2-like [Sycon ciliatum]|uniref:phospholipase A and acyltransferase 2-like n=1 Tax=Sycon ciliatum TaxID=27933 RepID=UPI0020AE5426|eukprot:scpid69077/ scgid28598/ Group XVI phospholipase A1/A2; H-rev 107 protein homolog; HRAS-like suppressor 3
MVNEKDGPMLSRWAYEEIQFANDDCGLCVCEVTDGKGSTSRQWSREDFPGVPGDILEFFRGTYLHYGVKVDGENVVHMTGDGPVRWQNIASSASENAVVKKELFSKVVRGASSVQVWNKYDDRYQPYPADKIVRRALSNIGQRGYHLLFLNCEHFSNWCRYGISMSHQAEVLGTTIAATSGAAIGAFLGPIGAAVGLVSGVLLATGSTFWRHQKEYSKVRQLKRSVSTAKMPSMMLRQHSIQAEQNGGGNRRLSPDDQNVVQ